MIDPIDGTKNFVRGVPVWATLIALVVDDEVVRRRGLRAAAAAALVGLEGRRRLDRPVAAQGDPRARSPTYAGSRTPRCRYSSLHGWDERGRLDDFLSLMRRCWRTRAYGDFWSYMLLAEGAVDIAAEPELELYDMAALDVIVREAGGRFTSLDGTAGRSAATRWPPTATCTTRRCRSSARCPTATTTPTHRRAAPGLGPMTCSRGRHPRTRTSLAGLEPYADTVRSGHADQRRAHGQAQQQVVTISPDATVRELLALLAEHNIGAVDRQRRRRRPSTASSASATSYAASTTTTRSSTAPVQRDHDQRRADLRAAHAPSTSSCSMMTERRIRHVPVVDRRPADRASSASATW